MPIASGPPPARKTPAKTASESKVTAQRREAIAGLGQLAQVPLIATRQYADAGAVGRHWPGIANEIAVLAEKQEQVARLVDPLIQVGPYTGLITAVLPFFLQIAVNHGRMAPGSMGTVSGELLSSQVETALANAELEALQAQRHAEEQARAMRQEIAEAREAARNAS